MEVAEQTLKSLKAVSETGSVTGIQWELSTVLIFLTWDF